MKTNKYNNRLLQEKDYADAFRVTLRNRYQALQNLQDDEEAKRSNIMEKDWKNIKQVWAKSCEEVVDMGGRGRGWRLSCEVTQEVNVEIKEVLCYYQCPLKYQVLQYARDSVDH